MQMFQVLDTYDHIAEIDIEARQQRLTKKQQRAQENQLREKFGDSAGKEDHERVGDEQKIKDETLNANRLYERHSGTGKGAFKKNNHKKRGHGKGNVGALPLAQYLNMEGNTIEEQIETLPVEEQFTEIVTVDDYAKQSKSKFGIRKDSYFSKATAKAPESESRISISRKSSMRDSNYPVRKYSTKGSKFIKKITQIDNKPKSKKRGKLRYTEEEFPSLG